jgi:hypothetical protein
MATLASHNGICAMKNHPQNKPLDEWPPAWIKLECASLLDWPAYLLAHDHEKQARGAPITLEEMRAFIRKHRVDGDVEA